MAAVLAALGFARYSGSGAVFAFFNLCFIVFFVLALPRPRLYVYSFLALFLGLGLWGKTLFHIISGAGFLEPVGDFANRPQEWDRALIAMSAAALGLLAARCLHLGYRRARPGTPHADGRVPYGFARYRKGLWIATMLGIVAINAANLQFAFFQIGINPKWLLPLRLHVLVAWLVNIGFALWIAALLWWDHRLDRLTLRRNLFLPLVEAFLSAASAFSRIAYLIHAAPYWLALWERRRDLRATLERRHVALLAGAFIILFVAAILTVFALRLQSYPYVDRSTGAPVDTSMSGNIAQELPRLIVQRWVGLEGVLTAGAVADPGRELLIAALTEAPRLGGESLFQRVAKLRPYLADPGKFTFLTNAGPVAILVFSGSATVVFFGMALIASVLILTEEGGRLWTGNPFLLAVSGAALANVVCQTTFFYLTMIFFLQMWLAIALLGALARAGRSD
jgi:hypothetical protein